MDKKLSYRKTFRGEKYNNNNKHQAYPNTITIDKTKKYVLGV